MANTNVFTIVLSAVTGLSLAFATYMGVRVEEPVLQAQAAAAQAPALSALDHVEIRNLVAKYARAIDTCSNNGYDYADLYTSDGSFNSSRSGKLGTPYIGRERLAEAAGGGPRGCKKLQREGGLWIHAIVNLVIEPSADGGAVGTSDLVYPSLRGKDFDAEHSGHVGGYDYVFAKTPRGWRFKSVVHAM
jgi:hypothetical protein